MRRLVVIVAVAAFISLAAVASAAVDLEVVVGYDSAVGEHPEGVAVDKRGDVFVSVTPLGQIRKYEPDGSEVLRVQLVPPGSGLGLAGLAVDAPGNLYVAAITLSPATQGVYKVARDGSFTRLPGTGADRVPERRDARQARQRLRNRYRTRRGLACSRGRRARGRLV